MKIFEKLFLSLPLPLSKWVFDFSREFMFKDYRTSGFEQVVGLVKDRKIAGDYLEFGVFKGSSLILFYNIFKRNKLTNIRFFAFDSFDGLPNSEGNVFTKGEFTYNIGPFLTRMTKAGFDLKRLLIVPGFFNISLTPKVKTEHNLKKAAVIHVDCDLYESTVDVLRFCEDLIQKDTILIFDDYLSFQKENDPANYGEKKAFAEWKYSSNFEKIYEIGPTTAFICKGL